ncbi:hypothetical protein BM1_04743 [Bipolaris maydis]|nr:hypothetical protein BM1_04743 [Bipolaris maydis]
MATIIAYGFRLPNTTDPLTHEMLENSHGFFQCIIKSKILDWYPSLKPSSRLPCFATNIEASKSKIELLIDHAAVYIVGIAFGGADTTRYTLQRIFKAMVLFPELQKAAQAEIDKVFGLSKLPSGEHLISLKYIRCTAKELVRGLPTAINGAILHAAVAEDTYRGYPILAGASIVVAVWSASHNPQDFEDPRTFRSERQDPDISLLEALNAASTKNWGFYGFDSGHRICPVVYVAENTLLIAIARVLWALNISTAEDRSVNLIEIDRDAMAGGLAAMPAPFK